MPEEHVFISGDVVFAVLKAVCRGFARRIDVEHLLRHQRYAMAKMHSAANTMVIAFTPFSDSMTIFLKWVDDALELPWILMSLKT